MAVELSPKRQFMAGKEESDTFTEMMQHPLVRKAMTYALAQMMFGPVTTEEMNGAKKFIAIFTGLGEAQEQPKLPQKALQEETIKPAK